MGLGQDCGERKREGVKEGVCVGGNLETLPCPRGHCLPTLVVVVTWATGFQEKVEINLLNVGN